MFTRAILALPVLLAMSGQSHADMSEYRREVQYRCISATGDAVACAAKAEIEDAARCALFGMRSASAEDEEPVQNPARVISDRKEALRLLANGDDADAILIAQGTRAMAGAACER